MNDGRKMEPGENIALELHRSIDWQISNAQLCYGIYLRLNGRTFDGVANLTQNQMYSSMVRALRAEGRPVNA